MKAVLGFLQRTAMCLEMDISTADVGGGPASASAIALASPRALYAAPTPNVHF